jgi:hypothetical protein
VVGGARFQGLVMVEGMLAPDPHLRQLSHHVRLLCRGIFRQFRQLCLKHSGELERIAKCSLAACHQLFVPLLLDSQCHEFRERL